MECRLCNLEKVTKWFYEDEYFIVCNCSTCGCKMIVLKKHEVKLTAMECERLIELLIKFAENRRVRFERKTIHDHWHMHIKSNEWEKWD